LSDLSVVVAKSRLIVPWQWISDIVLVKQGSQ
jgi:hypothetical protein